MADRKHATPRGTSANWGTSIDGSQIEGVGLFGQYNAAGIVVADGNFGPLATTSASILQVYLASALISTTDSVSLGDPTVAANKATVLALAGIVDNPTIAGAVVGASLGYAYDSAAGQWKRVLASAGGVPLVDGPLVDNGAGNFTAGTTRVFPIGYVADDAVAAVTTTREGAPRMTTTRVANAVLTDPTTITQRQSVVAPAATLNEATAQLATNLAVLYGFNPASGAGSAIARLTTVQGPVADVAGGGTLGVGLMATFDDVAAATTTENNVGLVRMTSTRILNTAASDPTTPTQRQAVDAAGNASVANIVKPVAAPPATPSTHQDAGSATTLNVKASAGSVYAIRVTNANAALRYFQLHNTAGTPAGGAAPQLWFPVPAGSAASPAVLELTISFFAPAERFATGIAWAWSTTAATYTAATAGDHLTQVRYV